MSKLTAETIAIEDLRKVRAWLERMQLDTGLALMSSPCTESLHREWMSARASCADLANFINARASGKGGE